MNNNEINLSDIFDKEYNKTIIDTADTNILMSLRANQWIEIAKNQPDPRQLFGNIWHEGEVAILFSNTGKGKSILGVQIADGISKGIPILGLQTDHQKSIYFDFELSAKPFQQRYTNESGDTYKFSDDLIRIEIDREKEIQSEDKTFEELTIDSIKYQIEKSGAKVVIIDNVTFLSATNEKSKEALALMKLILEMSRRRSLAILIIAHTPKRDVFRPIQLEDLAGSKALSNFCDVVLCIGESVKGSNIRYIKQLKNRSYPIEFHENNVMECKIVKENSFLQFLFVELNTEDEHLKKIQEEHSNDRIAEILELKKQNLSNVEIGKRIGVSEGAIRRRISKHEKNIN